MGLSGSVSLSISLSLSTYLSLSLSLSLCLPICLLSLFLPLSLYLRVFLCLPLCLPLYHLLCLSLRLSLSLSIRCRRHQNHLISSKSCLSAALATEKTAVIPQLLADVAAFGEAAADGAAGQARQLEELQRLVNDVAAMGQWFCGGSRELREKYPESTKLEAKGEAMVSLLAVQGAPAVPLHTLAFSTAVCEKGVLSVCARLHVRRRCVRVAGSCSFFSSFAARTDEQSAGSFLQLRWRPARGSSGGCWLRLSAGWPRGR